MVGQIVGKYRVSDRVGRGGMGTVYRATDETLHREVAIKVLNAELNDPEVAKRFRAEAITVARLSHPGIATIYELFEHENQWLMVMEFVRGETLEHMATRMGAMSAQRASELCMQALAALAHAHSMGVVHRDLKPANLMITENGSVKVMDFGIARVSGSEHLTNAGFMMGTPAYMAPEQVRGGEVDARADLYAMGVVFYRLVTGRLPFKGETAFAMVQSQVSEQHTPVSTVRSDLPAWVEEVVSRALSKPVEQRFQSAAEFHEAFARCLAGVSLASMYAPPDQVTMITPPRMPSGAFQSRPMPTPSTFPVPIVPTMTTPSGPSGPSGPSAPSGPSGPSGSVSGPGASPPAAPPAPAAAKPAAAKKFPIAWVGIGAAVVIGLILAVVMTSGGAAPAADPNASPSPVAVVDPSVTASPTPTPDPAATPTPTATTAANTPSPTGQPSPTATAARSVTTPATPSPTGTTAPTPPPAAGADAPTSFPNIKFYAVTNNRAADRDTVLNFGAGQLVIVPKEGGAPLASLTYKRITRGTYVRGRDPKWDPSLSSPPNGVDFSSGIGGLRSRHWLVLQGTDHYEILRLEDTHVPRLLDAIESRLGIKIAR